MEKNKILACTGIYHELISADIDNDGDYIKGNLLVRTVSNTFDNTRRHSYPDEYGYFISGATGEEINNYKKDIIVEMYSKLIALGFQETKVTSILNSLLQAKNKKVDSIL